MHCRGMIHAQKQLERDQKQLISAGASNSNSSPAVVPPPPKAPPLPPKALAPKREPLLRDAHWSLAPGAESQNRPSGANVAPKGNQGASYGANAAPTRENQGAPAGYNPSYQSQARGRSDLRFGANNYHADADADVEGDYWKEDVAAHYSNQRVQQGWTFY